MTRHSNPRRGACLLTLLSFAVALGCSEEDPPTCPLEDPFTGRYIDATTTGDSLELGFVATGGFPTVGEGGLRSVTLNVETNQPTLLIYETDCTDREGRLECARVDHAAIAELVPGNTLDDGRTTLVARIESQSRLELRAERSGGRMRFLREDPDSTTPLELELAVRVDFRSLPECIDLIDATLLEPLAARPACGNGFLDRDEVCDDGNTESGDGCSNTCEVEPAACAANPASWLTWTCSGVPSQCTASTCSTLEPDPTCIEGVSITGETLFTGRLEQLDPLPAFEDSTALWQCGCTEDALGRRCDDACDTRLGLCHELAPPAVSGLTFAGWSGSCEGTERCLLGEQTTPHTLSAHFSAAPSSGQTRLTLSTTQAEALSFIDAIPSPDGGLLFLARADSNVTIGAETFSTAEVGYTYIGTFNPQGLLTTFAPVATSAPSDLFPMALATDGESAFILSRFRFTVTLGDDVLSGDNVTYRAALTRIPLDDLSARTSVTLPTVDDDAVRGHLVATGVGGVAAFYGHHTTSLLTLHDANLDITAQLPVPAGAEAIARTPEGALEIGGFVDTDAPIDNAIPRPDDGFVTGFVARYQLAEAGDTLEQLWLRTFQEADGGPSVGRRKLAVDARGHTWMLWQSGSWRGLLDLNTDGSTAASYTEPTTHCPNNTLGGLTLDPSDDTLILAALRCPSPEEDALIVSRHSPEGALLTTERWSLPAADHPPTLSTLRALPDGRILLVTEIYDPDGEPTMLLQLNDW